MNDPLEIIISELLKRRVRSEKELSVVKRWASKNFRIQPPSNIDLIKFYHRLLKNGRVKKDRELEKLLRKRKIRSLSGVVVVSALTKPYPCPGDCIYCPNEKGVPKSYLSGEPAVERAKKFDFHPYWQVKKRVESLENQGHPTDKIELRIIGGSFTSLPQRYKVWFLKNCFGAANYRSLDKIATLEKEQSLNEKARHRIVGVSIETRPDLINEREIKKLRGLGVTMVEIGVQTIFDEILRRCQRKHGVRETINATKLLKDSGFKVMYQMMPNLPYSTPSKDLQAFKEVFQKEDFKPDWLKIYPCLVCDGTKLYQLWKKGLYKPYSDKILINLLIEIKKNLPCWVRLARVFRDIPATLIEAGSKISNLREIVQREMAKSNFECRCIRCREVRENYNPQEKIHLFREDFNASGGKEIFLSFENKGRTKLFSFLRLRLTSPLFSKKKHFIVSLNKASLIREIHTYGEMVPIKKRAKAPQHQGLGKRLVKLAENITKKDFRLSKIAVISGIGTRVYWKKLGYKLKDTYMLKRLTTRN
ncbi:MAG: tRNA uridine(34) 5-carboxymethylaminomethyl modification radical SAM/GNAT enzyme Elp3 [Patescibacteria group bacterium]